jgi:serine/threonine protein kinase
MKLNGTNVALSGNKDKDTIEYDGQVYSLKYLKEGYSASKGGNSSVFRLVSRNGDFAEKIIKFSKYPVAFALSDEELGKLNEGKRRSALRQIKGYARFAQEIGALYQAKDNEMHNIVEIEFDGIHDFKGVSIPYIVMEKADTDLKDYMLSNKNLDVQEKIKICVEIMKAVKQLHGKTIYHRDIKPDNILLFNTGVSGIATWKISDLGLISKKGERELDDIGEKVGPIGWLSPEAMSKHLTEEVNFGHDCVIDDSSDIFQLGKVFWFVFQCNIPIGQIMLEDFMEEFADKEYVFDIIRHMLQYSKKRRITIDEVDEYLSPVAQALGAI